MAQQQEDRLVLSAKPGTVQFGRTRTTPARELTITVSGDRGTGKSTLVLALARLFSFLGWRFEIEDEVGDEKLKATDFHDLDPDHARVLIRAETTSVDSCPTCGRK